MVREVINAASSSLYDEFGKAYKIHIDSIEQNLTRPSFFIKTLRPAVTEKLMGRSHVSIPLLIRYFPTVKGNYSECYEVADRLFQCLKYIEYDGVLYRGTSLKFDVIDDVLNFRVQYNFFTVVHDTDEVKPTIDEIESTVNTNREDEV